MRERIHPAWPRGPDAASVPGRRGPGCTRPTGPREGRRGGCPPPAARPADRLGSIPIPRGAPARRGREGRRIQGGSREWARTAQANRSCRRRRTGRRTAGAPPRRPRRRTCGTPGPHLRRRFHCRDLAVGGFVGAGAGPRRSVPSGRLREPPRSSRRSAARCAASPDRRTRWTRTTRCPPPWTKCLTLTPRHAAWAQAWRASLESCRDEARPPGWNVRGAQRGGVGVRHAEPRYKEPGEPQGGDEPCNLGCPAVTLPEGAVEDHPRNRGGDPYKRRKKQQRQAVGRRVAADGTSGPCLTNGSSGHHRGQPTEEGSGAKSSEPAGLRTRRLCSHDLPRLAIDARRVPRS